MKPIQTAANATPITSSGTPCRRSASGTSRPAPKLTTKLVSPVRHQAT